MKHNLHIAYIVGTLRFVSVVADFRSCAACGCLNNYCLVHCDNPQNSLYPTNTLLTKNIITNIYKKYSRIYFHEFHKFKSKYLLNINSRKEFLEKLFWKLVNCIMESSFYRCYFFSCWKGVWKFLIFYDESRVFFLLSPKSFLKNEFSQWNEKNIIRRS